MSIEIIDFLFIELCNDPLPKKYKLISIIPHIFSHTNKRTIKLLYKNLLAYFCLVSLITIALKSAIARQDHAHLEPIIQHYSQYLYLEPVLPTIRRILVEHSDLIRNLQEKRNS